MQPRAFFIILFFCWTHPENKSNIINVPSHCFAPNLKKSDKLDQTEREMSDRSSSLLKDPFRFSHINLQIQPFFVNSEHKSYLEREKRYLERNELRGLALKFITN